MTSLWPVTVRFLAKLEVKGLPDREYEIIKPLLASTSLQGLRDVTLKANLESLPAECAEIASRPVLGQTTAKIQRIYTKSLSTEPGEVGRVLETEVTSDFAYALAALERRCLYVKVSLYPTERGRVGMKKEALCTSKTDHDKALAAKAHTSTNITAGIQKSLRSLLLTNAVPAPDNLYGVRLDGCTVKCVCSFLVTTNKGRLLDIGMGVEGLLVICSKLLSRLPVPVKQKLDDLASKRTADNKGKRLRLKRKREEAQRKKDNSHDIRGMLAGAVIRPVAVNDAAASEASTSSSSESSSGSSSESDSESESKTVSSPAVSRVSTPTMPRIS